MKRRGIGVLIVSTLFAALTGTTAAHACAPVPQCVVGGVGNVINNPPLIAIPGQVPVVTILKSPPRALSTDALGAPSQLPLKTDTLTVKTVQPAFNTKRQAQSGGVQAQSVPPDCEDTDGWHYDIVGDKKVQFDQGNNKSDGIYNDTDAQQKKTISSSTSGQITVGAEGGVEVSASIIVASVSARFGVNVSASLSWTSAQTYEMTAPAHKFVWSSFGVARIVTEGRYYYRDKWCDVTVDKGIVRTMTPWMKAWGVWQQNI